MCPFLEFKVFGMVETISSYNLMIGIGIIAGFLILQIQGKKRNISKSEIDSLMVILAFSILIGFISAALFNKIYHCHNINELLSNLTEYSGLTFEGGLVGGAIAFVILFRITNKNYNGLLLIVNCITPSITIAHLFGRIGCFFGGCCFGKPTDSLIGIYFPEGSLAAQAYGNTVKVIPTQLIEAVFLLVLFFITYFVLLKYSFSFYLIMYGSFRFIIEGFRGDDRGILLQTILSPSQCISIIMTITGGLLLYHELKCNGDTKKEYVKNHIYATVKHKLKN